MKPPPIFVDIGPRNEGVSASAQSVTDRALLCAALIRAAGMLIRTINGPGLLLALAVFVDLHRIADSRRIRSIPHSNPLAEP